MKSLNGSGIDHDVVKNLVLLTHLKMGCQVQFISSPPPPPPHSKNPCALHRDIHFFRVRPDPNYFAGSEFIPRIGNRLILIKKTLLNLVLRSRSQSRSNRNYLRPGAGAGAGAEIIFLINISYSQFGGC